MAQRTIVHLVDDLDDTRIENGAGETVRFSLDRRDYEIDLTNQNAAELREALTRYTTAARKVGGRTPRAIMPTRSSSKSDASPQAVREWAKSNKIEVSAQGRIAQSVVDQFRAAGN
ncbi:MAG TPA: Lsr2 family protein [Blastococcus sp.]|nr:Lsr2 family protein [Blastococcus sp.]